MVDIETARQIALSLPGTEEYSHFGRPAFKIKRKPHSLPFGRLKTG
jgi:hypothetical protein